MEGGVNLIEFITMALKQPGIQQYLSFIAGN
jgi:hypothetical protein